MYDYEEYKGVTIKARIEIRENGFSDYTIYYTDVTPEYRTSVRLIKKDIDRFLKER